MRVIVCGGRGYRMDALDWRRLDALHLGDHAWLGCHGAPVGPVTAVYEGEAPGADTGARRWAESRRIHVVGFEADWDDLGRAAGVVRNGVMLRGHHKTGPVPPPELVVAFPGGVGTANMVAQARAAEVPVIDFRAGRWQRWGGEELRDLADVTRALAAADPSRPSGAVAREAMRLTALAHGGLGAPCCSAHLFREHGTGRITLPPGALYVGRTGTIATRSMEMAPDGDGSLLGNPIAYQGTMTADQTALALAKYRGHLRDLYRADQRVRALLDRIAEGGTLLVCWCHTSKPCHATVIAEAALLARASRDLKALGLSRPPPDLPVNSSRSAPTPRGSGSVPLEASL